MHVSSLFQELSIQKISSKSVDIFGYPGQTDTHTHTKRERERERERDSEHKHCIATSLTEAGS